MKKQIILITLFFIFLTNVITVKANSSIFSWQQTEINVNYGSDIEEAVNIIKLGITLKPGYEDPGFYVDCDGVNYTYIHVMRTTVLRTYHLYYEAVSPRYKEKEIKKVAFHIVDVNAPVVVSYTPIYTHVNSEKPKYLNYIKYTDDTTPEDKINVTVNDTFVNFNKVGSYSIFYSLVDSFGNETIYQGAIYVVDLISPVIEKLHNRKYIIGTPFNIYNFFSATDNYDVDLKLNYQLKGDLTTEGEIEVILTATDSSGNTTTLISSLEVIKDNPPIVVSSNPFTILIGEKKPDYLKFIIYEDDLTAVKDIVISVNDSGVNYDKVGKYEIVYKLIDKSGNETIYIEDVYIVDLISPIINKISNSYYELGTIFNIYDYFIIEDNYDTNLIINYEIKGSLTKVGVVEVYLSSSDSSGNTVELYSSIEVIATILPELILNNNSIEVDVYSDALDLLSYVEIGKHYGSLNKSDIVIDTNLNYELIGEYQVNYCLTDKYNNKSEVLLTIYVKDRTAPIIEVESKTIKQNSYLDLFEGVVVSDNYWGKEDIKLSIVESNVDINNPGVYFVMYEAVDGSGNHSYKSINVYVEKEVLSSDYLIYVIVGIIGISLLVGGLYIYYKKNNKGRFKKRFKS